jgi:hypothetical protein
MKTSAKIQLQNKDAVSFLQKNNMAAVKSIKE